MFPWADYRSAYTTGVFSERIHNGLWFALTIFTCLVAPNGQDKPRMFLNKLSLSTDFNIN